MEVSVDLSSSERERERDEKSAESRAGQTSSEWDSKAESSG